MPSFVVTLATLGIAQGTALVLTAGRPVSGFPDWYPFIGQGKLFGEIPMAIVIAACVYAVLFFILRRTALGVQLYAIGGNREAGESRRRAGQPRPHHRVRNQRALRGPRRHRASAPGWMPDTAISVRAICWMRLPRSSSGARR